MSESSTPDDDVPSGGSTTTQLPDLGDKPTISEVAAWLRQAAEQRHASPDTAPDTSAPPPADEDAAEPVEAVAEPEAAPAKPRRWSPWAPAARKPAEPAGPALAPEVDAPGAEAVVLPPPDGPTAPDPAYADLDALEHGLPTAPTPVVTLGHTSEPVEASTPPHGLVIDAPTAATAPPPADAIEAASDGPPADALPDAQAEVENDADEEQHPHAVPKIGLFTLPDEVPEAPVEPVVLGVPAIHVLPDGATVTSDHDATAADVDLDDDDAGLGDTAEEVDEPGAATTTKAPRPKRRQRVRYPRGQLKERIGFFRRLRALVGVAVVAIVLGVALAGVVGGILLFIFLAGRSAINS